VLRLSAAGIDVWECPFVEGGGVFDATMNFIKERKRKGAARTRAKRAYSPAQEETRRWVDLSWLIVLTLMCHLFSLLPAVEAGWADSSAH
jgi:hypothetical protein